MRVRTAVIPAAGLGTRFLPATKAVPKELLPIVDRPALQFIVDEAVGAGVDHLVIVTSREKPAIEAYFEPAPYVGEKLRAAGRDDVADALDRVGRDLRVSFTYQDEPRGLGHAVGCARDLVGDEPFVVMLPDELMADSALLQQMIDVCERTGGSVVGLLDVPLDDVGAYGVITPAGEADAAGVVPIATMVEKPRPQDAPSTLIIIGRYVLTPDVFDIIAGLEPGAGGEIQLTDALRVQAEHGPFHGIRSRTTRYDTGNPFGWLTAVVEHALADPRLGDRFREWLDARR